MNTKVLFIEDEDRGVFPYFHELEQNGFECTLAKDGDEAINKLECQKFDIITLDIMFYPSNSLGENITPIIAGLRLLEMIRRGKIQNCDPNIKVIVLTAVNEPITENKIRKLGVSTYLKKPIDYYEVINTFSNLKRDMI